MAKIDKGNPPFLSFELNLTRLAHIIDNFNLLLNEYNNISWEDFIKSADRYEQLAIELCQERDTIGLELKYANDLFDNIKLTYLNFNSERLSEYNKFYISINKLHLSPLWFEDQGKID